jgi:hypothetical protein
MLTFSWSAMFLFCLPAVELKIEEKPSNMPRIAKVRIKMIMLDHIVLR